MRVALVQFDVRDDESAPGRRLRITDLARAQQGADLVVLPELWTSGGFAYSRWAADAEPVDGPTAA